MWTTGEVLRAAVGGGLESAGGEVIVGRPGIVDLKVCSERGWCSRICNLNLENVEVRCF